jgi:hypothetical protein
MPIDSNPSNKNFSVHLCKTFLISLILTLIHGEPFLLGQCPKVAPASWGAAFEGNSEHFRIDDKSNARATGIDYFRNSMIISMILELIASLPCVSHSRPYIKVNPVPIPHAITVNPPHFRLKWMI